MSDLRSACIEAMALKAALAAAWGHITGDNK